MKTAIRLPIWSRFLTPENDPTNPAFQGWKLPLRVTEYVDGTQDVEYHPQDGRPNVVAADTRSMY